MFKKIWTMLKDRWRKEEPLLPVESEYCGCFEPQLPLVQKRSTYGGDITGSWGVAFEGVFYPFESRSSAILAAQYSDTDRFARDGYIGFPLSKTKLMGEA